MPQIVNFNNRQIIEPGAYSQIKSGIPVPAVLGTYGNVMIIDTGVGKDFGWGSGVNGEIEQGAKTIYSFDSSDAMKRAIKGGIIYDLCDYLWSPSKNGNGPRKVYYARAATTTTSISSISFDSGDLSIKSKSEGEVGNGVTQNNNGIETVVKGYSLKLKSGITNPDALILEFYEGQYKGSDSAGIDYNSSINNVSNYLLCRSSEFTTTNELLLWMHNDYTFNQFFTQDSTIGTFNDDLLDNTNYLAAYSGFLNFLGGSTIYNPTDLDDLLANMEDLDNSIFLCLDSGIKPSPALTNAQVLSGSNKGALSSENSKILSYCINTATYTDKILFIGGGNNANEFNRPSTDDGSLQISKYYNSPQVANIHSGIRVAGSIAGQGVAYKYLPSIYHATLVCGRVAGLEPQVPVTYKDLRITGLQHELKKSEREQALLTGVLHTRYQSQLGFVVNQGINTIQANSNLITSDGKSPEIQIMRIIHQINKELVINATSRFVGGNLNTSSAEDVKLFVEGYLTQRTATRFIDNLIISFSQVTVKLIQDYWDVKYCFVPNSPINRVFFTGFILDPKIEI